MTRMVRATITVPRESLINLKEAVENVDVEINALEEIIPEMFLVEGMYGKLTDERDYVIVEKFEVYDSE